MAFRIAWRLLATTLLASASAVYAQVATPPLPTEPATQEDVNNDEIVVTGRALNLIGIAGAASEGVVGKVDLEDRPIQRIAELLEVIPGFIATQHSGGGKANQYFL